MNGPNRVLANLPKNPAQGYDTFKTRAEADDAAAVKRVEGFRVRVTTFRIGPKRASKTISTARGATMFKVAWFKVGEV